MGSGTRRGCRAVGGGRGAGWWLGSPRPAASAPDRLLAKPSVYPVRQVPPSGTGLHAGAAPPQLGCTRFAQPSRSGRHNWFRRPRRRFPLCRPRRCLLRDRLRLFHRHRSCRRFRSCPRCLSCPRHRSCRRFLSCPRNRSRRGWSCRKRFLRRRRGRRRSACERSLPVGSCRRPNAVVGPAGDLPGRERAKVHFRDPQAAVVSGIRDELRARFGGMEVAMWRQERSTTIPGPEGGPQHDPITMHDTLPALGLGV